MTNHASANFLTILKIRIRALRKLEYYFDVRQECSEIFNKFTETQHKEFQLRLNAFQIDACIEMILPLKTDLQLCHYTTLRSKARKLGIRNYSILTKDELIVLILKKEKELENEKAPTTSVQGHDPNNDVGANQPI